MPNIEPQQFSYGIVGLRKVNEQWQVLLVLHNQGHWAFPKGHIEPDEDPHQCAVRELKEETGLEIIRFLSDTSFVEHYQFYHDQTLISKTVTYFLAEVSGTPTPQLQEVKEVRWVDLPAAAELITHLEARRILTAVQAFMESSQ